MNSSSHLNQLILFLKSIIIILFIASNVPRLRCEDDTKFDTCRRTPYECGHIKNVTFPFWGNGRPDYCGHPGFELTCSKENESSIMIAGHQFRVENISQVDGTNRVNFTWLHTENGPCSENIPPFETDLSALFGFITYPPTVENLTLYYDCQTAGSAPVGFPYIECGANYVYFANDSLPSGTNFRSLCKRNVRVPVFRSTVEDYGEIGSAEESLEFLTNALEEGFEVDFSLLQPCQACQRSDGECGFNTTIVPAGFRCFCRDGEHDYPCPTHHDENGHEEQP